MSTSEQRITMCRICEAHCGMVATVEDGVVTKLRPDREHPLSAGEACPKGIAMTDVQNDPDRVVHPLRRGPDGELHRVSWEEAIADIGARLRAVIAEHGPQSVGWYFGNPGAFSYSHALWVKGFTEGLGTPHYYTASSQDVSNRFAASALLYGSPALIPIPDLQRTQFLLMVGANPFVSHGSVLTAPKVKEQLRGIVARGGRVVVVDPRRTETARHFDHLPVRPDGDAWLLLSVLNVLVEEGLTDEAALAAQADGWEAWRERVRAFPPEATADRTGLEPGDVRALARDLAAADSAAVYGRTGSCLGRFGTLVSFLLDLVMLATGNLDRPGGGVFGLPAIAFDEVAAQAGLDTYGKVRSRIGDFPDVLGALPASLMAREMTTDGPGRIRAFFTSAGNPVLSCPNGDELEAALGGLDLYVSLDLYVNETNRHADYVLPATTWLERDDLPLAFLGFYTTPFVQYSEAVVAPRGEAREEWRIIDAIAREIGVQPYALPALRVLARLGYRMTPQRLLDLLLRTGREGDRFGLRPRGLSLRWLRRHPHGVVVGDAIPTGVLAGRIRHRDRRVQLGAPAIRAEVDRLGTVAAGDPEFPLRLIGLRELRSHNSWMHNAPLLMRGTRAQPLRIHPQDAARLGLEEGARARLSSKSGAIEVPVRITDEVRAGVVALAHGWGHRGGWTVANAAGGVNVNLLMSSAAEDLEPLAGMAFLNGVPVRVEALAAREHVAAQGDVVPATA
ncbi:MAG TPA: molybdopterin-dependent oxidoreductase [Solirubrobacteraceae bacterium]